VTLVGETARAPGRADARTSARAAKPRDVEQSAPWTGVERRRPLRQDPTQAGVRTLTGTLVVVLVAVELAWVTALEYAANAIVLS
jgi:hypothetical protein